MQSVTVQTASNSPSIMQMQRFRDEEIIGMLVAAFLHLALLGVLLLKPPVPEAVPVQTVTVSLAEDIGLEATAPEPVAESRMAAAPTVSDIPAPPLLAPERAPEPVQTAAPAAATPPKSAPTRTSRSAPKSTPKRESSSSRQETRRRPDRPTSQPSSKPSTPAKSGGATRKFEDAFSGAGSSTTSQETRAPATTIGPRERASVGQAIARQLKPHWAAPQGVDVDKLVTIIAFELNPDGSLKGSPRFVRQTGVNDANRSQAERHKEQAIRAIRLAAPFDLPAEYYSVWKKISNAQFDRNL